MPDELLRLMVIGPPDKAAATERIELDEPQAIKDARGENGEIGVAEAYAARRAFAEVPANVITEVESVQYAPHSLRLRAEILRPSDDSELELPAKMRQIFQKPAEELVQAQDWAPIRHRVNESLIAHKLTPARRPRPLRELANVLSSMTLVERVASKNIENVSDAKSLLQVTVSAAVCFPSRSHCSATLREPRRNF